MTEVSISEAKNRLTRLIHQAEAGDLVHITRRGKPVAVLLSEAQYERLKEKPKRFMEGVREMRAGPDFEPVDWSKEEIDSWREKEPAREFSWGD